MKKIVSTVLIAIVAVCLAFGIAIRIDTENGKYNVTIDYSMDQEPALLEDMGEVTEFNGEEIPTVEEVDGGLFEDETTGVSTTEGDYDDLGWAEWYNTSSPEAFRNDTIGKCIYANNRYGAQCVSLSRVFWWSYANRDVSTCGTGMAKGMMKCAEQNAGKDFLIFWADSKNQIQAGDWLVFDGGQYGHVGMALGAVKNGYVALLGENQGGKACEKGGSATNIINMSVKNLIGFYRPKAYVKPEPKPEPKPTPAPTPAPAPVVDKCKVRKVVKGDTMGKIMKECEGKIVWGKAMNDYANKWYSLKYKKYLTVYQGWASSNGVGLFAGDTIEYHAN